MGRFTTKEEAELALKEFERQFLATEQLKAFFKKIWLGDDDHGFYLNVKVAKDFPDKIPSVFNKVKICLYKI